MNLHLTPDQMMRIWLWLIIAILIGAGVISGYFKARKIQPRGFKWKILRWEAFGAALTLVTGWALGKMNGYLWAQGWLASNPAPATWWQMALEYTAYFIGFDTYFYWLHRWMHVEPIYSWVHKWHHKSTSPNVLTTVSVNPLESLINGGFVPLFLFICTALALPIHQTTLALILPTNIIMGFYVHSGYEFLPRWWNKSWATKWFISATFHDQHHRFFTGNFGGYTTVWDRLCGTMRSNFEPGFDQVKARAKAAPTPIQPAE